MKVTFYYNTLQIGQIRFLVAKLQKSVDETLNTVCYLDSFDFE